MKIKCENCPYYSGEHVQGHGEYWGNCNLLETLQKTIARQYHISEYDLKIKFISNIWDLALNDDSECLLIEYKE